MNLFDFIPQYSKMLKNLDTCLQKATEYAKTRGFEVDTLVQARLAPDQYALDRQIQSACDSAKFSVAYLMGKEPPVHPDNEKTIAELRARIKTCCTYLETVRESDVQGGEDRKVAPKWLQGKSVKGDHFLMQMSVPNFYFHVTTAYAILRHNGVPIGKMDYIGNVPMRD
jgi:hypothetical protein